MSVYQDMVDVGVPMTNHYSDLYVKVTPESQAILERYKDLSVSRFMHQGDGTLWYDIAFQYMPYWDEKDRG